MDGSYKVGVMTWDGNFVRLYLNGIKQSESVQTVGDINETTPLIF